MFGIWKPRLGEVNEIDRRRYHSCYCGVCRELGRMFAPPARLHVSFDMVLLGAVLHVREDRCGRMSCLCLGRCRPETSWHRVSRLLACASMYLVDVGLQDAIRDGGSRWANLRRGWMRGKLRRASAYLESDGVDLQAHVDRHFAIEGASRLSVEEWCEPTALGFRDLVAAVARNAAIYEDIEPAAALGYRMGQATFLHDALADLESDRREGQRNPFLCGGQVDEGALASGKAMLVGALAEIRELARAFPGGALLVSAADRLEGKGCGQAVCPTAPVARWAAPILSAFALGASSQSSDGGDCGGCCCLLLCLSACCSGKRYTVKKERTCCGGEVYRVKEKTCCD